MMGNRHCHFVSWHPSGNWSGSPLIFKAKIRPSASHICRWCNPVIIRDVCLVVILVRTNDGVMHGKSIPLRISMHKMPSWWVHSLDMTDVGLLSSGRDHRSVVFLSLLRCPCASRLSLSLRTWLVLCLSSSLCLHLSRWWGPTMTEDPFLCFGWAYSSSISRSLQRDLPFTRLFLELGA